MGASTLRGRVSRHNFAKFPPKLPDIERIWMLFIDRKRKFYLKCMLCDILHFEVLELFSLRRKKIYLTKNGQSLLAHQDWQIKQSDWLIKPNPARNC